MSPLISTDADNMIKQCNAVNRRILEPIFTETSTRPKNKFGGTSGTMRDKGEENAKVGERGDVETRQKNRLNW
jgi:hypothetical protein